MRATLSYMSFERPSHEITETTCGAGPKFSLVLFFRLLRLSILLRLGIPSVIGYERHTCGDNLPMKTWCDYYWRRRYHC